MHTGQRRRGFKKLGAGSCNFPTDECWKFRCCPQKFFPKWRIDFRPRGFHFWTKIIRQEDDFWPTKI